ncbi:unnamed protein product, partial [Mesorhabditis belari]|uniref:Uncharacterized protein n=1 Tax=Mesorhabditis belari TaxID=2138241 RepID=A0AAF3FH44_9BILA
MSVCKWPNCDATERSKWSLVTHLQDHHASDHHLRSMAIRRRDGTVPKVPPKYRSDVVRELPPHPGYTRNAAAEAIGRHAFKFLPREITDEPEGPVTRSIRLTACLILRNLARYSSEGRQQLRRHERTLCWLSLSRLEGSTVLAQLLAELHSAGSQESTLPHASSDANLPASEQSSDVPS